MTELEVPHRSIVAAHVLGNSSGVREEDSAAWARKIADPIVAADHENMAAVFEDIAGTAGEYASSVWLAAVHLLRLRAQELNGGER